MTDIDLSQNRLRYLDDCNMLQCARKICVDNNKLDCITRQGTLNLPCLEELSLNNNSILSQGPSEVISAGEPVHPQVDQTCYNLTFADLLQVDETTCIKLACSSQQVC